MQVATALSRVTGTVRDDRGQALAGAAVTLAPNPPGEHAPRPAVVLTDSRGDFVFAAVAAGRYTLRAGFPGPAPRATADVTVATHDVPISLVFAPEGLSPAVPASSGSAGAGNAPSDFGVAGVEGTIAPSGYAAGVAERQSSQIAAAASTETLLLPDFVFNEGRLGCDSEAALRLQVDAAPADAAANHRMGLFYLQHGDAGRSLPFLLKGDRAEAQNVLDLAVAYRLLGRNSDALQVLGRRPELDPKGAIVHEQLAETLASLGRRSDATAEFLAAAALDRSERNVSACGFGLIRLGEASAAEPIFQAALSIHPHAARLWLGLGLAQSLGQRQAAAIRSLVQAASLAPDDAEPYALLALLSGVDDASDQLIEDTLNALVQRHPERADAHYDKAQAQSSRRGGRSSPAERASTEQQLKIALTQDPALAGAHFQLGILYADEGNNGSAIAELGEAARLHPSDPETHYRLAGVYRRQNDPVAAERELDSFKALHAAATAGQLRENDSMSALLDEAVAAQATPLCSAATP